MSHLEIVPLRYSLTKMLICFGFWGRKRKYAHFPTTGMGKNLSLSQDMPNQVQFYCSHWKFAIYFSFALKICYLFAIYFS